MELHDLKRALHKKEYENSWPPPPEITRTPVDGELAERILAFNPGFNVELEESVSIDGYSEYTYEHYYDFTILVDRKIVWESDTHDSHDNGLRQLLKWLDANTEPVVGPIQSRWKAKD